MKEAKESPGVGGPGTGSIYSKEFYSLLRSTRNLGLRHFIEAGKRAIYPGFFFLLCSTILLHHQIYFIKILNRVC